jgi:guanosine-3',5'-bis(diphosphate) 3'-pyrophosphohydrolase
MATLVARRILSFSENESPNQAQIQTETLSQPGRHNPVIIHGSEGAVIQLAPCCLPIPGDHIIGQLKRDQGLVVHIDDCHVAKRQRSKEPERWIDVMWANDLSHRFDCRIKILVKNERGILARVAAEIGESDANITHVGMDEDQEPSMALIHFTIQVEGRIHLARLIRNIRRIPEVTRLIRERG